MILKEGSPRFAMAACACGQVFAHTGFADVDAEFQ
jgi:hypothetical protein